MDLLLEICAPFVTSVFWTSHQLERGQEGRSPRTWWIGRPKPRLALLQKRREPQSLTWHHLPGAVHYFSWVIERSRPERP